MPRPAPLTVYTHAKCSTCRAAVAWLRAHGVDHVEKPIYDQPPGLAELARMLALQGGKVRSLFNTSGIQYRERNLAAQLPALSDAEALALLASDGRLVKRPFLLGDGIGLVGFSPAAWQVQLAPRV